MIPNPIPIPARNLPIISTVKDVARAITPAPDWNTMAAKAIVHFRPTASDVLPPAKLPNREMMLRIPMKTSSWTSVIFKSSLRNRMAPLMTPTSAQ